MKSWKSLDEDYKVLFTKLKTRKMEHFVLLRFQIIPPKVLKGTDKHFKNRKSLIV